MRVITKLAIVFYTFLVLIAAFLVESFVLHRVSFSDVTLWARIIYDDPQMRVICGASALLVFFINWFFIEVLVNKEQREKNIAFDNPLGRVTVSLIAMEDLVQRICFKFSEVKDVRSVRIKSTKRGMDVRLNLALSSEVNIPQVTANLQEIIKHKIIETMWVKPSEPFVIPSIPGSEDKVTVRINVTKIVAEKKSGEKERIGKSSVGDIDAGVPFQGYRA